MCFTLSLAGVFHDFTNVLPIVLGAHIGTCATALISSVGANIEARRCAVAHQVFNVIGVMIAALFAGLLTRSSLSRRQAILLQYLDRCVVDIERTGDHITALAELSIQRKRVKDAVFTEESFERLFTLYEACTRVQWLVTESLDPEMEDFKACALEILETRDVYRNLSLETRGYLIDQMEVKSETPVGGYFYSNLINAMDRIVRHSKNIALVEQSPAFWIKSRKFDAEAQSVRERDLPELVKTEEYLKRLHEDDVP